MTPKKFYVLDAYALIYRGYFPFANRPRMTRSGLNTSAVFGFMLTFDEIRRKAEGEYIAVAFDSKGPTFRHEAFESYKAQRPPAPEPIQWAVPYIKEILKAFGVKIYEAPGYEADDIVGTIAEEMRKDPTVEVLMVTPDKDYAQLVDGSTFMLKPETGATFEKIGPDEVTKKYGLQNHRQMIDYLALVGDASDNVPGCPGIGPKTASNLLMKYDSVDEIYNHIDDIKGKMQLNLINNKEQVMLSKELVTIMCNVPIDFQLEECAPQPIDVERVTEIYEELEFRSLMQKLLNSDLKKKGTTTTSAVAPEVRGTATQPSLFDMFAPEQTEEKVSSAQGSRATIESVKPNYHRVNGKEEVSALAKMLAQSTIIAFDTETDGLEALTAGIVGASLAVKKGEAYYIPLPDDHDKATEILSPLKALFLDDKVLKVGQNLKFDIEVLERYGIAFKGPFFDTMIAHYLLNPELHHSMDYMAEVYLNYQPISIEDLIGKRGRNQLSMREVDIEKVVPYAAEDADVTLQLYEFLAPKIKERGLEQLFYEMEMPLMQVLIEMEQKGVRVDTAGLDTIRKDLNSRLAKIEEELFVAAGTSFNVNSPKEVGEVLFDTLKLDSKPKKTKTGNYATSEAILEKLKAKHPAVDLILRYRGLRKLLSTYVDALPQLINPDTGRVHTTYNQTVTATGRLSSTNPNLQNIPVRDDDGREIRKAFTANDPTTQKFVSADYSQIELRLMAHMSGDEHLIDAFKSGKDIHAITASKIFDLPLEEVTSEMRRRAKTANFGIIYGISAFGLSERLSIPRKDAAELIQGYFDTFPKVKDYMEQTVKDAADTGYVETIFGRRRYLKDIHSSNNVIRGYAERNAINAPLQGSAADIIKMAMVNISNRLKKEGLHADMILQVHDELNFSVPSDEVEKLMTIIKEEMENVYPELAVPLTVDVGVGDNWLEAH